MYNMQIIPDENYMQPVICVEGDMPRFDARRRIFSGRVNSMMENTDDGTIDEIEIAPNGIDTNNAKVQRYHIPLKGFGIRPHMFRDESRIVVYGQFEDGRDNFGVPGVVIDAIINETQRTAYIWKNPRFQPTVIEEARTRF